MKENKKKKLELNNLKKIKADEYFSRKGLIKTTKKKDNRQNNKCNNKLYLGQNRLV